jgi:hypothetical protein
MKKTLKTILPYILTMVTLLVGYAGITLFQKSIVDFSSLNQMLKYFLGVGLMYIVFFPSMERWFKFWKNILS